MKNLRIINLLCITIASVFLFGYKADADTNTPIISTATESTATSSYATSSSTTKSGSREGAKETVTSSTPRSLSKAQNIQGAYLGSINFTSGYSFKIREDGAYLTKMPLTNTTVVIPDSVKFNGKYYPVNVDYSYFGSGGCGRITTIVFPPTLNCINFGSYYQFSSIKNLIYTSSSTPMLSYSNNYYYTQLLNTGIFRNGNYYDYAKDTLDQPKVSSTISKDDNFNLGSVVVDECEYELYSGGYASAKNFSYSTDSYHVNDSVMFNGSKFEVIQLDDNAFSNNSNANAIYLPDSIKYYLGAPFENLTNLKHVYCQTPAGLPVASSIPSLFVSCGTSTIEPLEIPNVSTSTVNTGDSGRTMLLSFVLLFSGYILLRLRFLENVR